MAIQYSTQIGQKRRSCQFRIFSIVMESSYHFKHSNKDITWNVIFKIIFNFLQRYQNIYLRRWESYLLLTCIISQVALPTKSLTPLSQIKKKKSKYYYQLYVNATKIEPTCQKKWLKDLNLKNFNWNLAFTQISKTCKENKLSHQERVICLGNWKRQ